MYRKLLAAVAASLFVAGGLFAEEIKGVFKKFEDNKVTVDVDGKEKTYSVDPATKVKRKFNDKEFEFELAKSFGRYKDGTKVTLTVEGDKVVDAKGERGNFKGKGKTPPKDN